MHARSGIDGPVHPQLLRRHRPRPLPARRHLQKGQREPPQKGHRQPLPR